MAKALTAEERARRACEDIWLHYFNKYLYEHGTISEKEYHRMTGKISQRNARPGTEA